MSCSCAQEEWGIHLEGKGMQNELTVIGAARKLGLTLDAVYRSIYSGRLPARKQAGRWLIPASAVAARLKSREVANGTVGR
jgi:excisionase family DNA binding protein